MRTLYRNLLVPTLCVAVSVLMFVDVSHAKKGGNSGSNVKVDVRAELEPCGAVAPAASPSPVPEVTVVVAAVALRDRVVRVAAGEGSSGAGGPASAWPLG